MNREYTTEEVTEIAGEVLKNVSAYPDRATVVALEGNLGAGKTTLAQAVAGLLGVRESVVSPTFVIAKFYQTSSPTFTQLVHIDAYRIESEDELGPIRFDQILQSPNTLVLIEWPKRINSALPEDVLWIDIDHKDDIREITIHEK